MFPTRIIVVRGKEDTIKQWQAICHKSYSPHQICLAINDQQTRLPEGLAERAVQGDGVAYICSGFQCSPPINSSKDLVAALSQSHQ